MQAASQGCRADRASQTECCSRRAAAPSRPRKHRQERISPILHQQHHHHNRSRAAQANHFHYVDNMLFAHWSADKDRKAEELKEHRTFSRSRTTRAGRPTSRRTGHEESTSDDNCQLRRGDHSAVFLNLASPRRTKDYYASLPLVSARPGAATAACTSDLNTRFVGRAVFSLVPAAASLSCTCGL